MRVRLQPAQRSSRGALHDVSAAGSERSSLHDLRRGIALEERVHMFAVLGLSILIGISLGLLGGGGSILTVPLLTYVGGMSVKTAIASSLFVVGVTSAAGVITHARAGRVRWRTGLVFGAAGMVGAYAGGQIGALLPGGLLMILFGLMMVATAIAMLRKPRAEVEKHGEIPIGTVIAEGIVVGVVTGIVGAGGGFLVVPALVLLGGLPTPQAVGTSLVVIAMKSFAGFAGYLDHVTIDWPLTLAVTATAVGGSLIGGLLVGRIPAASLRRGFGLFVIVMAAFVFLMELTRC